MLRIYLVRHGQTPCSMADVLCGRCDPALTAAGRRSADDLATWLGTQPWTALYSSPLQRARQTIAPLARACKMPVRVLPALTEIDFGRWDGRSSAALQREDPAFAAWVQQPAAMCAPGGESGDMVQARAVAGIASICAAHKAGRVLVMTHKTTLRLLLCHFTGTPAQHYRQRFPQPLGAVNVVDFLRSGPHLRSLGDISYQRGSCQPSHAGGAA